MTSWSHPTNKDHKIYVLKNFMELSIAALLIHEGKIDHIHS